MRPPSSFYWSLLTAVPLITGGSAAAEVLSTLFPEGVPGYDTAQGVTVQSRLHPEQDPLGLRAGAFQAFPRLDETLGYTSNLLPSRRGSWQVSTAPSLLLGTDWSRDAFGAALSMQDTRYLSQPRQNRTDAAVSLGGRIDIGEDQLTLGAAHLSQHEDRAQVDSIASDRPIAFQLDDLRASYTVNDGRWSVVPSLQVSQWTYGGTTILGQPASQSYRDRIVVQGDVTLRYEWTPLRNLLLVVRALGQDYTHMPMGQPTLDSQSYQILGGVDYSDDAVWRWRVLVGGEARQFDARIYRPRNTLIAEADASWSPSGLTTVHATVSRDTEDAAQAGVGGLTHTAARLTIDHEYRRDLLLKASAGMQQADFFQGGRQTGYTAGVGLTWVLNRETRVSFTYDQIELRGSRVATQSLTTGYSGGVALMTVRFGL